VVATFVAEQVIAPAGHLEQIGTVEIEVTIKEYPLIQVVGLAYAVQVTAKLLQGRHIELEAR